MLLLVRYSGDISTKARATRRRMVSRLARNLKDAIEASGVRGRVLRTHDRLFADLEAGAPIDPLLRVFGVQSVSPVERRPWHGVDDVVREGAALFTDAVRGRRFAVRARRVGDRTRIPIDAGEVQRALGATLLPHSAGVDLDEPDVSVRIEVMEGEAYFFLESERGPGGLPVGVEGRAVALVSGGFDSAVAAWHMMKRGVALDYVFCNLGGRAHELGALRVMKVVADRWSYGTRPRFHAIDFSAVSADLQERAQQRLWQILLKRLMLRAAERVARSRDAPALVTGEAVGQVSSQTLRNLAAISEATALPILRPVVAQNKDEILDRARAIGTYELSKVVGEYCAMVPRKPATGASLQAVRNEEARLDPALLEEAVAERGVFDLRALDLDKLDAPELETHRVPEGATVIDLRSRAAHRAWHYEGALQLDFAEALRAYPHFDKGRVFVLYCEFGLKSAHLAERMRDAGFEATHFRGGLREVLAYARARGLPAPESG